MARQMVVLLVVFQVRGFCAQEGLGELLTRVKEGALELFVPLPGLVQELLKFRLAAKTCKRVAHEVGIAKEAASDTMPQHVQGGGLVAQNCIGLRDLIDAFRVADAALFYLVFGLLQEFKPRALSCLME